MGGPDDSLSDDLAMDIPTIQLPPATLGSIADLEANLRIMSATQSGRDSLSKALVDDNYLNKLIPLVEDAEDLEALPELHRLCNIMKTVLLMNDSRVIERAVSDECIMGVVGALEYDPDFPSHKANHRQWLNQKGRYKEVVRIEDNETVRKIHQTYRLQYLKDVVLARILDDSTFGVLNSMIFYNQVEIVTHLDGDINFLNALFAIFADPTEDLSRKKDAVLFIQQSCAIAKNLQPGNRAKLYHNLLQHGLLQVINFGLRSPDVAVRVGATDILVSMIDHDPQMIRHTIYRQISEKQAPLTDSLIDLLLVEVDLGIKSQISDALKVLLDSNPPQLQENGARGNPEMPQRRQHAVPDPQQEIVLVNFYEKSAGTLFRPLLELEKGVQLRFNAVNDGVFSHLTEILCFYLRQHQHRSKYFILQHNIVHRFVHLLDCKEKHLQLGMSTTLVSPLDVQLCLPVDSHDPILQAAYLVAGRVLHQANGGKAGVGSSPGRSDSHLTKRQPPLLRLSGPLRNCAEHADEGSSQAPCRNLQGEACGAYLHIHLRAHITWVRSVTIREQRRDVFYRVRGRGHPKAKQRQRTGPHGAPRRGSCPGGILEHVGRRRREQCGQGHGLFSGVSTN